MEIRIRKGPVDLGGFACRRGERERALGRDAGRCAQSAAISLNGPRQGLGRQGSRHFRRGTGDGPLSIGRVAMCWQQR